MHHTCLHIYILCHVNVFNRHTASGASLTTFFNLVGSLRGRASCLSIFQQGDDDVRDQDNVGSNYSGYGRKRCISWCQSQCKHPQESSFFLPFQKYFKDPKYVVSGATPRETLKITSLAKVPLHETGSARFLKQQSKRLPGCSTSI